MNPADKGLFTIALIETIRNSLIIVLVILVVLAIRDTWIIWNLNKMDKIITKHLNKGKNNV